MMILIILSNVDLCIENTVLFVFNNIDIVFHKIFN